MRIINILKKQNKEITNIDLSSPPSVFLISFMFIWLVLYVFFPLSFASNETIFYIGPQNSSIPTGDPSNPYPSLAECLPLIINTSNNSYLLILQASQLNYPFQGNFSITNNNSTKITIM